MKRQIESLDDQITEGKNILCDFLDIDNLHRDFVSVYSWPQRWPSTACGFGGMAGQAFTTAQTLVVVYEQVDTTLTPLNKFAVVFHGNQYAYTTKFDVIKDDFDKQNLPGKVRFEKDNKNLYEKESVNSV